MKTGAHPWSAYLAAIAADQEFEECKNLYEPLKVAQVSRPYPPTDVATGKAPRTRPHVYLRDVPDSRVVLIGEPGAGKSWMLRKLALDTAGDAQSDIAGGAIPVYLDLNLWRPYGDPSAECLLNWVAEQAGLVVGAEERVTKEEIWDAITTYSLLLEFDGLNELNDEAREHFLTALTSFDQFLKSRRPRDVRILIGTRRYGFSEQALDQYTMFEIMPPNKQTKARILSRYLPSKLGVRAKSLIGRMDDRMQRLTDNILMLRFYGESLQQRGEAATRAQLIEKWVAKVLRDGGISEGEIDTAVSYLTTTALLCQKLGQLAVEKDRQIIPRLQEEFVLGDSEARRRLEWLLNTGVLRFKVGLPSRVSFAYPQLMEYFAARRALEVMGFHPSRETARPGPAAEKDIKDLIKAPRNHEIIALAAGLLEDSQVWQLQKRIEEAKLDHDTHLVLTAMVLSESPSRQLEERFADQLFRGIEQREGVLRRLSMATLILLGLVWMPGFLAFAVIFRMFEYSVITVLWSLAVVAGWYFLMPRALVKGYGRILSDYLRISVGMMATAVRALTVLRSARVELRLRRFVEREPWIASTGLLPSKDIAAIADDFRRQIAELLVWAIDLIRRDLDTILDELRRDPRLVEYLIRQPEAAFGEREVRILLGFVKQALTDVRICTRVVDKLVAVARNRDGLKKSIVGGLQQVGLTAPEPLKGRIDDALVRIQQPNGETLFRQLLRLMQEIAAKPLFVPLAALGPAVGGVLGAAIGFYTGGGLGTVLGAPLGLLIGLILAMILAGLVSSQNGPPRR